MRAITVVLLLSGGAWGLVGCGASGAGCIPGQSAACACTSGQAGAQLCRADRSYDPCVCASGSTSGCVPGQSLACGCSDGRTGAQTCRADRKYDPCVCSSPTDLRADIDLGFDVADLRF